MQRVKDVEAFMCEIWYQHLEAAYDKTFANRHRRDKTPFPNRPDLRQKYWRFLNDKEEHPSWLTLS